MADDTARPSTGDGGDDLLDGFDEQLLSALGGGLPRPIDWSMPSATARRDELESLWSWVVELVSVWPVSSDVVPPCWFRHEPLVRMLSSARDAYLTMFHQSQPASAAVDWMQVLGCDGAAVAALDERVRLQLAAAPPGRTRSNAGCPALTPSWLRGRGSTSTWKLSSAAALPQSWTPLPVTTGTGSGSGVSPLGCSRLVGDERCPTTHTRLMRRWHGSRAGLRYCRSEWLVRLRCWPDLAQASAYSTGWSMRPSRSSDGAGGGLVQAELAL